MKLWDKRRVWSLVLVYNIDINDRSNFNNQ